MSKPHPSDCVGRFLGSAITAPQNADRVVHLFREITADARGHGFTDEEVARAKRGLLGARETELGFPDELQRKLGEPYLQGRTLADEGNLNEAIQRLTPTDIKAVIRDYIDPAKWVVPRAGDVVAHRASRFGGRFAYLRVQWSAFNPSRCP
jgi:zinc protease